MQRTIIIILFLLFNLLTLHSQDLTNIKENKPITITGGCSLMGTLYGSQGMEARRDPFSWAMNANVNINLYGILDLPFSIYLTKQNTTYNQPSFQQFGVSPKYKWLTVHAGYRSMQFSQHTLNGVNFLGGGIEIQPEKSWIKYKALYGRFTKAIAYGDTISSYYSLPAYERWGFGNMITIGTANNSIDLIFFKAKDKEQSIEVPDTISIKPQENLVIGFNIRNKIWNRLNINVEYALSAYTADTRLPEKKFDSYTYANNLGNFFKPRYSTSFSNVIVIKTDYQGQGYSLGVAFKRVDPEYKSLGISFLTSDIINYTINASKTFFKNKLSLNGSFGKEKNNIEHKLQTTNTRLITSFNASFTLNENWNFSANYSNFNANTEPSQVIISDSIKYAQITKSYGGTANYNFGKTNIKHAIILSINNQTAYTMNKTVTEMSETGTDMKNATLGYVINFIPKDLTINTGWNYTDYSVDSVLNITTGPMMGVSKNFLNKKLRANFSSSFLNSYTNKTKTSSINVFQLNLSYQFDKHHSFQFSNSAMFRKMLDTQQNINKHSKEFKGSLTYSYHF